MADNQDSKSQAADILVVDDTIASLRLLTEILSKEGYQVRPADGPHVALQSAMAHPPGLILLDVRMPDMDGFEVCRRLKQDERTRDVPVIFVSALQDVDDRVQGFEVGGVDFVSKPIEEAEVLARVKTHLQLRTMQLHLEELVAERTAELVQTNETLRREIAGRKQAEKALRESEARFRAIFDHAPMGIAVAGSDSFMVDANDAFQRMVGYTSQELGEIEVSALSPAEDNERELPLIQEVLQGSRDTYTFEKRFKHRDGREVWTQTHSAVVRDENGEVWFAIGLVQDITERKEVETQREAARRRSGKARRGIAPWSNKPKTGSSYFKMVRSGLPIRMSPDCQGARSKSCWIPHSKHTCQPTSSRRSPRSTAGESVVRTSRPSMKRPYNTRTVPGWRWNSTPA